MAKSDKKDLSKEVDQILKSGLVMKKGKEYFGYIKSDTKNQIEQISLGFSDEELLDNLSTLDDDKCTLVKQPSTSDDVGQAKSPVDDALQSQVSSEQADKKIALEELLGEVSDLSPDEGGGDLDIFLDGVNVQLATSRHLPKDHPVKTIPLEFRWNDKKKNVENGDTTSNRGWTVLRKDLARKIGITVTRDDTPRQNFFTVKSYVLCVCKKEQFVIKKLKQAIKYKIAAAVEMERRQQAAKDAAIKSRTNIDSSLELYQNDYLDTLRQTADVGHVRSEGKRSAEDIMKKLETDSVQELLALSADVDNAVNTGQLLNTVTGKSKVVQQVSDSDI